jgi:Protein of unknown function (DUF1822)
MTYFLSDHPDIYQLDSLAVDTIPLDPAQIQQALQASQQVSPAQQWTVYRDQLAQLSLLRWLGDREIEATLQGDRLLANGFQVLAIATSSLDEAEVSLVETCVEQPAQIYVLVEVAEELQQAWIKGFIRHDQLQAQAIQSLQGFYDVPIAAFDPEPGNILLTLRCADPRVIPLPTAVPRSALTTVAATVATPIAAPTVPGRLSDLSQTVINVRNWLTGQVDTIAEELADLAWVLLPQPAYALRSAEGLDMRFASDAATEFAQLLQQLRSQGVQVPADAQGGYQNLELGGAALRLYAMAGTVSIQPAEWSLLIVLGSQSGSLPDGITLKIREGRDLNQEQVLIEQRFDATSQNAYLYADVIGHWDETFSIEIVMPNGETQHLPLFAYTGNG